MTKVGGQRRAFYERDPVLVDTILSYDVDSEYKEIQRKRLYCQNLFKQILRNWACAHLRPLLHLVDRKILAREGHYTKRLKLSVRIGAWVCRDQCTPPDLGTLSIAPLIFLRQLSYSLTRQCAELERSKKFRKKNKIVFRNCFHMKLTVLSKFFRKWFSRLDPEKCYYINLCYCYLLRKLFSRK